jgi:hypothetical protein
VVDQVMTDIYSRKRAGIILQKKLKTSHGVSMQLHFNTVFSLLGCGQRSDGDIGRKRRGAGIILQGTAGTASLCLLSCQKKIKEYQGGRGKY